VRTRWENRPLQCPPRSEWSYFNFVVCESACLCEIDVQRTKVSSTDIL
jgi:hypothetical protein